MEFTGGLCSSFLLRQPRPSDLASSERRGICPAAAPPRSRPHSCTANGQAPTVSCRFGQLVCAVKLREAPVLRRVDMRWAGICAPLCDTVSTTCQTTSTRISGNNNNQQPTNQPTKQPTNQANQPTNQTNQTTKQPNNQQPTTNKQQPTTNNQQTTTNNQQPTQQQLQLQLHT